MAIPEQLKDRVLVGSIWKRRVGKHKGQPVKIESFNGSGVRFHLINTRGWQGHNSETSQRANIPWDMFLRLYEIVELKYMDVTVDNHGLIKEVHNAQYQEAKPPSPILRECTSQYHKGHRFIDIGRFSPSERKGDTGRLRSECDDCNRKRKEVNRAYNERLQNQERIQKKVDSTLENETPVRSIESEESVTTLPQNGVEENLKFSSTYGKSLSAVWLVTVIQKVEHTISAPTYLDAAAKFDGTGEIVKIEKL